MTENILILMKYTCYLESSARLRHPLDPNYEPVRKCQQCQDEWDTLMVVARAQNKINEQMMRYQLGQEVE